MIIFCNKFSAKFLLPSQRWNFAWKRKKQLSELIQRDIFGSQHNFCINDSLKQKKKEKKVPLFFIRRMFLAKYFQNVFRGVFTRERARFNQKPDAVVFLLKGAMKFVYQFLRLPFLAAVFLSSKNFSKNFFPPLGLPLRNRISLDKSQIPFTDVKLECETLCFARENGEIRGPSFTKLCLFREY